MKLSMKWTAMLTMIALGTGVAAAQAGDVETRAMQDEMQRSLKELHLDENKQPYYIAYKILDVEQMGAHASFGALTNSGTTKTRLLSVDVRIGDYNFDSSNYANRSAGLGALMGMMAGMANLVLPVDDNYEELRRKIWLATDVAYKKAVEDYSGKKAALAARGRDEESVPDYSKAEARQESDLPPAAVMDITHAEELVKATSAVFRKMSTAEAGTAEVDVTNSTEHFVNSEGTHYVRRDPEVYYHAAASLQNPTGEIFNDSVSEYGHALSELPDEAKLTSESQEVAQHLQQRLKGKVAKRYNGPVLVEGQAAAELFARNFGNLLASHPQAGTANSLLSSLLSAPAGSLINKVGTRVLPDYLTVVNNPLLTQADGHTLLGSYKFDEEGIPARETVLVKDGMLKTLLSSRKPARGIPESTGSMRGTGVMPGNLFVETSKGATRDELKQQLIDLLKQRGLEYGYILRRLSGNAAVEAFRVFPDGREELVRDARIAQVNAASFKDVLAVSKDRTVFTDRAMGGSFLGASLGASASLVTYVVPDMLFEDMSVEHVTNQTPKLPVVPSPLAE
jgi:predicted Zn-dependent protease